jgi:hypothetical protein
MKIGVTGYKKDHSRSQGNNNARDEKKILRQRRSGPRSDNTSESSRYDAYSPTPSDDSAAILMHATNVDSRQA